MTVLHEVKPAGSARPPPPPNPAAFQMGAATVNRKLCTLSISVFLPRGFSVGTSGKESSC